MAGVGSSSRLSCCLHLLHLQANLPSVVGPAQVLRGPTGWAGWAPQTLETLGQPKHLRGTI